MKRTTQNAEPGSPRGSRSPAAFLLAQVGAHAASKFGERVMKVGLTRPHSGILWNLGFSPSITQRQLAARLRILPSRLVSLLDDLESRGLIERRRTPHDRRRYSLHLTEKGRATVKLIGEISRAHQKDLLMALSEQEQSKLSELLQRVADQQGLTPGVHPGYARLGESGPERAGIGTERKGPSNRI
jgi:DNA-binding MarR family transcriptional regulator